MFRQRLFVFLFAFLCAGRVGAEVTSSGDSGFQIKISTSVKLSPLDAYRALTANIDRWWIKDHTYTGDASNLSLDFTRGCFIEKLPDNGFVRHMEIVFHQPGKTLRLTGGLGPLQSMGICGAMTFEFRAEGTSTVIDFSYNVCGFSPAGFKELAPVVDQVLNQQLDSLQNFCDTQRK